MADKIDLPLDRAGVIDRYFLEHRAKLIDLAAYLDRVDRAGGDGDFRDVAFRQALQILVDGEPQRARRVLDLLSDHSTGMPQSAEGTKGAAGAPESLDSGAAGGGA